MTKTRLVCLCWILGRAFAGEPGLRNFERIDDNVYRGRQPSAEGWTSLAKLGIRTVIDLRGGPIHLPRERRLVNDAGLIYVGEHLSGVFEPRDRQIAKLLAVMQDPSFMPVFVHCTRGCDRSGVLIACYRMVHDHWTNEQAYAEACTSGLSPLEVLMRRYIRHFDPQRVALPASPLALFDFLPAITWRTILSSSATRRARF